jgi:hypothetical protein
MSARVRLVFAALLVLSPAAAVAQQAAAEPAAGEAPGWEFNASVYGYFPPEDRDYAQPTVTADHGALHLEGRYNYEGFRAGSVWVGWNLGVGEKLRLDATLMAGGVFGDTRGVAPGYELTLSYGKFELYSEGEWVFDVEGEGSENNFFYSWAQLGYSPLDWLTVGLASQRTRAYQTALDIQRGVFVGFTYKSWSLNVFVFNPGWDTPTVVSSLAVSF